MAHRPRKRFGQNFLNNPVIIEQILQVIDAKPTDHIVEIGPGLGALTCPLLKQLSQLVAIEIDNDLYAHLQNLPTAAEKLRLIHADALTIDYSQFGKNIRIIGNLPYNISTPLLFHLLKFLPNIQDMLFMLQKEVVERMAAEPGSKDYGRLSVMIQYHCQVDLLFHVPPAAFSPQPKVDSAIVRLTPHTTRPFLQVNESKLEYFMTKAFSMRRKTLANNLKPLLSAQEITALNIDPLTRPEQVSVEDFVRMAHWIEQNTQEC